MGGRKPVRQRSAIADFVSAELAARADAAKAGPMAAYMKTSMPFYGVQKDGREEIMRALVASFEIDSAADYRAAVKALWQRPHREEKYMAIRIARRFKRFIEMEHLEMYLSMVREGAWWDLVDEIATRLVGGVWFAERAQVSPLADGWINDGDLWIRRTAILGQNRHRAETDEAQLFRFCLERAHEKEFFIRKAIGWALRDYSYAAPERVRAFLLEHRATLSGLSFREGAKRLVRDGLMS